MTHRFVKNSIFFKKSFWEVSNHGWMDKQNVTHTNNRILFSLSQEENAGSYDNMKECGKHYAKKNKPVTKEQTLYDSTCIK